MSIKKCVPVADICRMRGDTDSIIITVTNADNSAFDFTGYLSAKMAVSPDPDPANTDSQLFEVAGVFNIPSGTITFNLSKAQATNDAGVYYHDIKVTDSASKDKTIARGKFELVANITDAGVV